MQGIGFRARRKMHLLAAAAGKIQPIDFELGCEAGDWILKPRRGTAAFNFHALRALRNPHNLDCIEISAGHARLATATEARVLTTSGIGGRLPGGCPAKALLALEASDTRNGVVVHSTRHTWALYGAQKVARAKPASMDDSH